MSHLNIFTDGSVNTRLKFGYGACLVVSDLSTSIESLKDTVIVKRFEQTSSTKLELQILLWALNKMIISTNNNDISLTIYTDSQNIIGLPKRRAHLERNNFFSGKNKQLNNYELYQTFYRLNDKLNCQFVKVIGHQASNKKDGIDKLFSLVDQASRRALRENS